MGQIHDLYRNYLSAIEKQRDSKDVAAKKKFNAEAIAAKNKFDVYFASAKNIFEPDEKHNTLLTYAVFANDTDLIKAILERSPSFRFPNNEYCYEFELAAKRKNKEVMQLFITRGANINQTHPKNGYTMLECVARAGIKESIAILMDLNADITIPNKITEESIFTAAAGRSLENYCEVQKLSKNEALTIKHDILNSLLLGYWSTSIPLDLTNITFESGITDNLLVFGATINNSPITQQTPGFEKAFPDFPTFLKIARKNEKFDYETIYLALKRRILRGDHDPELEKFRIELKKLWKTQEGKTSLERYCAFYLADSGLFKTERQNLAPDLAKQVEKLAAELEMPAPNDQSGLIR